PCSGPRPWPGGGMRTAARRRRDWPMPEAKVAVIGGGIAGLAHAYIAARRGWSVVVFDRNERPQGASIRNFGMIWPIGQPPGDRLQLSIRSRNLWLEVLTEADLPIVSTGSLHLAYNAEEAAVIQEFAEIRRARDYPCRWLDPGPVRAEGPSVRGEGLLGGLWSDTELVIDPRRVVDALPRFLADRFGVRFRLGCAVHSVELPCVRTARETWEV